MGVRPLLLLGTGGFALEVADLISETPGWRVDGFANSLDRQRAGGTLAGQPVFWVDDLAACASTHHAFAALGSPDRQKFIEKIESLGFPFATVCHPSARVSGTSTVGEGTLISVGCVVAAYARIGRHVVLNRAATVGHHSTIEDYVTIGPGVHVAGSVNIGSRTCIGIGATIIDHLSIGADVIVAAGAVVTKDVPGSVTVRGVPARIVPSDANPH